jgi:hypothetical protein
MYYRKHNSELFSSLDVHSQILDNDMKRLTDKVFEPYNLFAFIIHDPAQHRDFAEKIREHFLDYHYKTGERLLFFALTQPPEQWKDEEVQPEYYKHLQQVFYENRNVGAYPDQIRSNLFDKPFHVQAIAKTLKIPIDQLPAIVITTHPSLWSFRWYKTCAKKIRNQLQGLAFLANDLNRYREQHLLPREFQVKMIELLEREYDEDINLCEGKGDEFLTESLATALSELLSFLIQREDRFSNFQQIAKSQIPIAMARVIESIKLTKGKLLKEENNEKYMENLDELSEKIGIFITLLQQPKVQTENVRIPEFELDSNQLIEMGNNVGRFIKSYEKHYPELDFTPAAICLAKAFEIEINKSIVHWIRKKYDITLPEYYCKVQPGVDGMIIPNMNEGKPIDFNKPRKNGTWHPPAMGQSYLVASKNIEKKDWQPYWEPQERKLLLREWQKIADLRNLAAHSEKVSSDNMVQLIESINTLCSTNVLSKMAYLRQTFKGLDGDYL